MTTTPCTANPDEFYNAETALSAAAKCSGCPLFYACRAQGEGEEWGVWGGEVKPATLREVAELEGTDNPRQAGVLALYDLGYMTTQEIAMETSYSESQVQRIVSRFRASAAVAAELRRAEIAEAIRDGGTAQEIASRFGCSVRTVSRTKAAMLAAA